MFVVLYFTTYHQRKFIETFNGLTAARYCQLSKKSNSYRVVALPTAKKTFSGKEEIYGQNTNITSFFRVYSNPVFEFTCIGLCATPCSGVTLYLSGAVR